ncbi:hypothetical protein [uncultured Roseovarius sp.]|uniref:hypothetical protein n=1 Tax=uncultured Roseovarius sp. TaxID=293344 RepID=UPI002601EF0C|nr:hypothetical protein [uncultured Roseovarius sp.]
MSNRQGPTARGGKPTKLAHISSRAGFSDDWQREANHFAGIPWPRPDNMSDGTTEYFEWRRVEWPKAREAFCRQTLNERIEAEVSEEIWQETVQILRRYLDDIESIQSSPRNNNNKNDPQSWNYRRDLYERESLRMLDILNGMLSDDLMKHFDERLFDLFPPRINAEGIGMRALSSEAENASNALQMVIWLLRQLEPQRIQAPHDADLRRKAGAKIKAIALENGLPGKEFVRAFNIYEDVSSTFGFDEWYQSLNKTE